MLDLKIGTAGDPPEKKAVIKIAKASFSTFAPALAELEEDLEELEAVHGALVVVGDFGPEMKEPRIEHVKTLNGRDVLLMHLPLPVQA